MSLNFRLVVATRESKEDFYTKTATGKSIALYDYPFVEVCLAERNKEGLPRVYNRAIEAARTDPAILVFVHDDVHLCDFYWARQLSRALEKFAIVGLAGNKRRVPNQPAWAFVDRQFTWDSHENMSGVVGHGPGFPPRNIAFFGEPGEEVKLLDGLLLACRSETLIQNNIRFDEMFEFDFYDMDLCRQAEAKQVKMGTCDMSVVHESSGKFGTESWQRNYAKYLAKWKD